MSDWDEFVAAVNWFRIPERALNIGKAQPWTRGSVEGLPKLSALFASATLTPLSIAASEYELLAWGPVGRRRGWLCRPPTASKNLHVHSLHKTLWTRWGGIVEQFGEHTDNWWSNQDEILTATAARTHIAGPLSAYAWIWEEEGLEIPIKDEDYYVAAQDVHGNLTLVKRGTGHILMFAPDHAFDGVTELPGCPPYSLLTIDKAPDLVSWIEASTDSWNARFS